MEAFSQKKSLMTLPAELRLSILNFVLQGITYCWDNRSRLTSETYSYVPHIAAIWISRMLRNEALPLLRHHLKVHLFTHDADLAGVPLLIRETAANVYTHSHMEAYMRNSRPWFPEDYVKIFRSYMPCLQAVNAISPEKTAEVQDAEQLFSVFRGQSVRSHLIWYLDRLRLKPAPPEETHALCSLKILFEVSL